MHPSELKNQALVAAAMAERDGFSGTARALVLLAAACATEAQDLLSRDSPFGEPHRSNSTLGTVRVLDRAH